ncbi:MAG: LysR substrate-binding domain-containing protein [Thalassobaculum sp.]|uniref:LysR substrate-binding domain-containing protein n=1 Tax=Thalassobaculum sp. TaxID=2022740 RepID=UPI0032EF5FE7
MRPLPSATALQAFEAAGRLGSFLLAARELNVTPGAVSRRIQALEAHLGRPLFERDHKRVALTASGDEYLRDIQVPLQRIVASTERLRAGHRAEGISVCAYPTFAIRWLIPRWGRLHDRYPQIDIRLSTSLEPAAFDSGQYDLAFQILRGDEARRGLDAETLLDIDTYPVCAPALAERIHAPSDLAAHTLLHSAPRPGDWPQWLDAAGVAGIDPGGGLHFETTNLAWHAAIEGLGVAIGVEALVAEDLAAGRLVRPFEIRRRSRHPIGMVCAAGKAADPLLGSVRDWFRAEAAAG